MGYYLEALACGGIVIAELIGILAAAMLIQGVVYWITGFSIYNWAMKKLIIDQL